MSIRNKSKEKVEVNRTIFNKVDYKKPLTWWDIKGIPLHDNDEISAGWNEGYCESDCSMDGHYYLRIMRKELETDKEYQERQKWIEQDNKWAKERRLESYKKLREEFKDIKD